MARAVDLMASALAHYETLFEIPFALPKLDWVAVPGFGGGAMENWGLILSRETDVLFSKDYSSALDEMRMGQVIAHEIAHSWFGNLVTTRTWDDLWLNEGFASYFQTFGARTAFNDFDRAAGFVERFYNRADRHALEADQLPWSRQPLASGMQTESLSCGVSSRTMSQRIYLKVSSFPHVTYVGKQSWGFFLTWLSVFWLSEFFNWKVEPYMNTAKYIREMHGSSCSGDLSLLIACSAVMKNHYGWFLFFIATLVSTVDHLFFVVSSCRCQNGHALTNLLSFQGASILQMLHTYLARELPGQHKPGEDPFIAGLRDYLNRHKFSNAATPDLWKALEDTTGVQLFCGFEPFLGHCLLLERGLELWRKKDGQKDLLNQIFILSPGFLCPLAPTRISISTLVLIRFPFPTLRFMDWKHIELHIGTTLTFLHAFVSLSSLWSALLQLEGICIKTVSA